MLLGVLVVLSGLEGGRRDTFGEGMGQWHGACQDQSDQGQREESQGQGTTEIDLDICVRH